MSKTKLQHITASLVIAALVVTSLVSLVSAAPVTDSVRSSEITGTIPGGEFKEIWLDLEVIQPGKVTVVATWGSSNLDGLGFYILDDTDVANVASGAKARDNNLAKGNPMASFRGDANQQEANFRATASMYKLIIFNESANDADFDMTATNAYIVGDSDYVSDPAAPEATDTEAEGEAEGEVEADSADAETEAAESTSDATTVADVDIAATTTSTETVPAAAATATTTTVTTEADSTVVRADTLEGSLPEKDDQHFLGLEPTTKDGRVVLSLTYEPQDQQQLDRRLNFWVLDSDGFTKHKEGRPYREVAIAAGSTNVDTAANERVAEFKVVGLSEYTVIVYNSSNVPATYTLTTEGALLVDGSGQTDTAQAAAQAETAADEDATDEAEGTTAADATPAAATSTAATSTAATSTGAEGEPGGSYTIQAGDSMSAIARDVYGDIQLYDEICAYNNIEDCDRVEVGDKIQLPTTDELDSGATAPATPITPVAAPAVNESAAVTTTATTTATSALTETAAVTTTSGVTSTTGVTGTSSTVIDSLAADGRFKTLIAALDAANLVDTLEAEGPFTVFAPVDAAFAALPAGALDKLVAQLETDPRGQLLQILLYHVSTGELLSADFENGVEVQTMQGNTASFVLDDDGNLTLNGAAIADMDMLADNGVVHAIEAVILPPTE